MNVNNQSKSICALKKKLEGAISSHNDDIRAILSAAFIVYNDTPYFHDAENPLNILSCTLMIIFTKTRSNYKMDDISTQLDKYLEQFKHHFSVNIYTINDLSILSLLIYDNDFNAVLMMIKHFPDIDLWKKNYAGLNILHTLIIKGYVGDEDFEDSTPLFLAIINDKNIRSHINDETNFGHTAYDLICLRENALWKEKISLVSGIKLHSYFTNMDLRDKALVLFKDYYMSDKNSKLGIFADLYAEYQIEILRAEKEMEEKTEALVRESMIKEGLTSREDYFTKQSFVLLSKSVIINEKDLFSSDRYLIDGSNFSLPKELLKKEAPSLKLNSLGEVSSSSFVGDLSRQSDRLAGEENVFLMCSSQEVNSPSLNMSYETQLDLTKCLGLSLPSKQNVPVSIEGNLPSIDMGFEEGSNLPSIDIEDMPVVSDEENILSDIGFEEGTHSELSKMVTEPRISSFNMVNGHAIGIN